MTDRQTDRQTDKRFLGEYLDVKYYESPIATSPEKGEKYVGVNRLINVFGESTVVAHFQVPMERDGKILKDEHGKPYMLDTYYGKEGLKANPQALHDLQHAEHAIRKDPRHLADYPSASGNEANPMMVDDHHKHHSGINKDHSNRTQTNGI